MTGWLWGATTVVGALAAVGLVATLCLDVLVATISRDGTGLLGTERGRRLVRPALALAVVFVAAVLIRFGVILHDRPGP